MSASSRLPYRANGVGGSIPRKPTTLRSPLSEKPSHPTARQGYRSRKGSRPAQRGSRRSPLARCPQSGQPPHPSIRFIDQQANTIVPQIANLRPRIRSQAKFRPDDADGRTRSEPQPPRLQIWPKGADEGRSQAPARPIQVSDKRSPPESSPSTMTAQPSKSARSSDVVR